MKARCAHGPLWYEKCPWCETDERMAAASEGVERTRWRFPFWRNMTQEEAAEYVHSVSIATMSERMRRVRANVL